MLGKSPQDDITPPKFVKRHYAQFTRHTCFEDIGTVAHFHDWKQGDPEVGDLLLIFPKVVGREGQSRRITGVSVVRLLDVLTGEELDRLGCGIDEYFESWDRIHPNALAKTDPLILRVEFEPTGEIEQLPLPGENEIIRATAKAAYEGLAAQEDARVFADINKACQPV